MSQPVKVSDQLILDARIVGTAVERSIAGQIEFWARLGRAIEPLLQGDKVIALCRAGNAQPLSECLEDVDTDRGRKKLSEHLKSLPFPHYEPAETPGLLWRIEESGKRTLGKFVNRQFQVVKQVSKQKAKG